jgi:hypothetical protein
MPDTILDGSGEQTPGRRLLDGTDLEIAYNLLGGDPIGTRADTVRDVGYRLGRVASKLIKATREKVNKT